MTRRDLIALLGTTAATWPIATGAGEAVVELPTRSSNDPPRPHRAPRDYSGYVANCYGGRRSGCRTPNHKGFNEPIS
jgi:hypothetical protein